MIYSFDALSPEYESLLAKCLVTKLHASLDAATRLLRNLSEYQAVEAETKVPAIWLMAVNERESGGKLDTYLGNGQPLDRVTTEEPEGRGPFLNWHAGAIDALKYDKIDQVTTWNWARACFQWELWNGFGYRYFHKEHSPYLWAGTSIQESGKYVADGEFDRDVMDQQLGTVAIARAIAYLHPSLDLPGYPQPVPALIA